MIRIGKSTKEQKQRVEKKSFMLKWFTDRLQRVTRKPYSSTTRGSSTPSSGSMNRGRKGAFELVVRRGERVFKGEPYWRGFEERVQYFLNSNTPKATHKVRVREPHGERYENQETYPTYLVRLVEPELHANTLAEICTVEFRRKIETASSDELYKKFYDVVMTVDTGHDHLIVEYSPFLETTGDLVLPTTRQPQRVQATDESDLGMVARRVAADACFYVFHTGNDVEFRTPGQVTAINECLDAAVDAYFHGLTAAGNNNNV